MHCDLVSDYVETPTHEVRAHDTHAQLSRARGGGRAKRMGGKASQAPPSSVRNDSAGGRAAVLLFTSARGLSDVPVPRRGGRRDETGTHVRVDLLRKSGLAVRIAYSLGEGRAEPPGCQDP